MIPSPDGQPVWWFKDGEDSDAAYDPGYRHGSIVCIDFTKGTFTRSLETGEQTYSTALKPGVHESWTSQFPRIEEGSKRETHRIAGPPWATATVILGEVSDVP